jgi:hypothetical protein
LVWILEDDIYFHSLAAFNKVLDDASSRSADLVLPSHMVNRDGRTHINGKQDWHWLRAKGRFELPWFGSITCVAGLSSAMLGKVAAYASKFNRLEYVELMLSTLAEHANLTVFTPDEFQDTIVFRQQWTCADLMAHPLHWFHPVKDWSILAECDIPTADVN